MDILTIVIRSGVDSKITGWSASVRAMPKSSTEAPDGPSGMRVVWQFARVSLIYARAPKIPARPPVASHRKPHFPIASFISTIAACLGALLAASIVLEAFDADLALWPSGTGDFTAASHTRLGCDARGAGAFPALQAAYGFVMTAGALLVARYRARSAIASDAPSISVMPFTMAEPWGPHNDYRPGARPFCLRAVRRWWVAKGDARPQWMHR